MKRCRSMYLLVSIQAETDEEATEKMTTWLSELPPEYSGIRLGFQGMYFSDKPLTQEDAWALNSRSSDWYREGNNVSN